MRLARTISTGFLLSLAIGGALAPGLRAQPRLEVTPVSIEFGCTLVGEDSVRQITVVNTGGTDITIAEFRANAPFVPPPQRDVLLAPGGSFSGEVHFLPMSAVGSISSQLILETSGGELSVSLTGLAGTEPTVVVAPTELQFNQVAVGDTATLCVVVHNPSCRVLRIDDVDTDLGPWVYWISRNLTDLVLEGGEYDTICISFSPDAEGGFGDLLYIRAAGFARIVGVTGFGVSSAVAAPAELQFGAVELGTYRDAILTVTNDGGAPVTITAMPVIAGPDAADFQIVGLNLPATIARGLPLPIRFRLSPSFAGDRSASVLIANSSAVDPIVALHGIGVTNEVVVTPDSVEMGDVLVGSARTEYQVIVIDNQSNRTIRLDSLVITGADSSAFGLGGFVVAPIAAREKLLLDMRFAPTAARDFSARAEGKLETGMRFTIYLHGRGVLPEPPRDRGSWLDSASASVGERTTLRARVVPEYKRADSVRSVVAYIRVDPTALYPHSVSAPDQVSSSLQYRADGSLRIVLDAGDAVIAGTDLFTLELEGLYTGLPKNIVVLDSVVVSPNRGGMEVRNGLVTLSGCDIREAAAPARIVSALVRDDQVHVVVDGADSGASLRLYRSDGLLLREASVVGDSRVVFEIQGVGSIAAFLELRAGGRRTVCPLVIVR